MPEAPPRCAGKSRARVPTPGRSDSRPGPRGPRAAGPRSAAQRCAHSGSADRAMPWAGKARPASLERRWRRWVARTESAAEGRPSTSAPWRWAGTRPRPPPALDGACGAAGAGSASRAGGAAAGRRPRPRAARWRWVDPPGRSSPGSRRPSRCPPWACSPGEASRQQRGAGLAAAPRRSAPPAARHPGLPAAT